MSSYSDVLDDEFSEGERRAIEREFSRLENICYLDNTGSALYTDTYIKSVAYDLCNNVYGNPHSNSLTSRSCSDIIDQIRFKILEHFHTDAEEYSVVFTSGATGALKLIAESFVWNNRDSSDEWSQKDAFDGGERGGQFVYMEDNHTSVLGMRDVAAARGATLRCLSHEQTFSAFDSDSYTEKREGCETNSLFVYSAQCNFSGVKYPLEWIGKVQNGVLESSNDSRRASRWYCLLDAATFVSTNRLDLSAVRPDFVCISFYKMFGYPTGLGALIVRNGSGRVLNKLYYGGGTVSVAFSSHNSYIPRPVLNDRFEDGTINFLSIVALQHGFNSFNKLVGSMDKVSRHTFNLARYVFNALLKLHHSNGNPAVRLYSDTAYDDLTTQGNIVNFNIIRPNGEYVGYAEVLHMANVKGIQLRTGCFCNPGACRRHLSLSIEEVKSHYKAGHVCGDEKDVIGGKPTGSVRASFGYMNTGADADALISMIEDCFVQTPIIRKYPAERKSDTGDISNPNNCLTTFDKMESLLVMKYIYLMYERVPDISFSESLSREPRIRKIDSPFLSNIFIYPVKSCAKYAVASWDLDSAGLKYDRAWMITNEYGVALTQKKERKLCLIRPIVDLQSNKLRLTYPGFGDCSIDLEVCKESSTKAVSLCRSKVCNDRIEGLDCGDGVAVWLSEVLDRRGLRLIRQISASSSARKNVSGPLSLANKAQYLLINDSSIRWLSERIDSDSDCSKTSLLDRFRCNFVVSGVGEPLVEQTWSNINVKNLRFKVDGSCRRCEMICIDQNNGRLTKEPLTTLSKSLDGKLVFGVYLSLATDNNVSISVGDEIGFV